MFSPSTLRELQNEVEKLRAARHAIDLKLQALEAILAPITIETPNPQRPDLPGSESDETAGRSPHASNGLRAQILSIVNGRPMKAPEVTKALREGGWVYEGSTPLPIRVYNDMWRMARDGILSRDPEGRFFRVKQP